MSNTHRKQKKEYLKHIDNYNFIDHIVLIKCIKCGEFFEPDKTKDIEPVCAECKNKPVIPEEPELKKTPMTPEQRKERKYQYNREYIKTYYRKHRKTRTGQL